MTQFWFVAIKILYINSSKKKKKYLYLRNLDDDYWDISKKKQK